jgi:hypothetical protein
MESQTTFLDCPAYLDDRGMMRCGLPAEVQNRFIMRSTNGPLECATIRCPDGHFFNGPIEFLSMRTPTSDCAGSAKRPEVTRPA